MFSYQDYQKIRVGVKSLEGATLNLGNYRKLTEQGGISKQMVYAALANRNLPELRKISNLFYNVNGMYQRICDYFAFLYRYDWYIEP